MIEIGPITHDREAIIRLVHDILKQYTHVPYPVVIIINDSITKRQFSAVHVVLFSCLAESMKRMGCTELFVRANNEMTDLFINDISAHKYFSNERSAHVISRDDTIFNLWRIVDTEIESYSLSLHNYLKRSFFHGCDLSGLKNALTELYYNVYDHAEANGNAFSYIQYSPEDKKIYVAVCDLGIGIARSLRTTTQKHLDSDRSALSKAIEKGITSGSREHNMGLGLDSVVNLLGKNDYFRIVSNRALLFYNDGIEKTYDLDFDFPGTLIYFDYSIDSLENEEIVDSFYIDE